MTAILDLRFPLTLDIVRSGTIGMSDPKNMVLAFGILLISGLHAEIYATHYYFRFMSAILFPVRTKSSSTKSYQDILPFGENRIKKFLSVPEIVGVVFRSPLCALKLLK